MASLISIRVYDHIISSGFTLVSMSNFVDTLKPKMMSGILSGLQIRVVFDDV